MLEEIAERILTKEDLIFFLDEIDILKGAVFKDLEIPLFERVKERLSGNFQEILKEIERILPGDPNQQITFFEELKGKLLTLPQIKLELAFYPSREFILELRRWLKEATGKTLILDIAFNPKIVGGLLIEYQGRYADFSLEKEIDKYHEEFL